MFKALFDRFLVYFQARGVEELKSFLFTFWATFIGVFGLLAYNDLLALTEGIEFEVVSGALFLAAQRSFWTGLAFAIWPEKFQFRVTGEKQP